MKFLSLAKFSRETRKFPLQTKRRISAALPWKTGCPVVPFVLPEQRQNVFTAKTKSFPLELIPRSSEFKITVEQIKK
jgi:hypothetical protein